MKVNAAHGIPNDPEKPRQMFLPGLRPLTMGLSH